MRFIALFFLSAIGLAASGQILTPAHWTFSVSNPTPAVGEEIELLFKASIDKDWYLYASEFPCEDGPIKTTFTLKPHPGFQLVGKVIDINPIAKHDKIFDCDVKIFKGTGEFRQKIKILNASVSLKGELEYQVCTDIDGKCIPFNDDFSFDVKVGGSKGMNPIKQEIDSLGQTPVPISEFQAIGGPILDKSVLEGEPTLDSESFFGYLIFAFILGLTSLITP